jgi:hypothetical protein
VDLAGNQGQEYYHTTLDQVDQLQITLNVGWDYTVYVDPADTAVATTSDLLYSGHSGRLTAQAGQTQVDIINVTTDQALVTIDTINVASVATVEFWSDNTYTTLEATYNLGATDGYYAMYVVDRTKGYRFIVNKTDGTTANVKVYNIDAGQRYILVPKLYPPEEGDGDIVVDIDSAFTDTIVDI